VERLGDRVSGELKRLGPAGSMADVVDAWPAAVGAQIAAHAWPARITRDGTLVVHARDSIWAFELGQRAPEILSRLGQLPLKGLKFVPGPLPEAGPETLVEARADSVRPGPAEEALAAELASPIESEDLRESVQRAAALSLARAAADRSFW
jgi:hypothetical protein